MRRHRTVDGTNWTARLSTGLDHLYQLSRVLQRFHNRIYLISVILMTLISQTGIAATIGGAVCLLLEKEQDTTLADINEETLGTELTVQHS